MDAKTVKASGNACIDAAECSIFEFISSLFWPRAAVRAVWLQKVNNWSTYVESKSYR